MYKLIEEIYQDNYKDILDHFMNTKAKPNLWYMIKYAEDGVSVWECTTKGDVETLLTTLHIEGSHTDNDTYEVYHDNKQYSFKIKAIVY